MTSDSEQPIEIAITQAARAMTAHAAPDLRARVAARLGRPAPVVRWWQPLLAASAIALGMLAWWPTRDTAPPPPPRDVVVKSAPLVSAPMTPKPAPAPEQRAPRGAPAALSEPWPTTETTVAPLGIAALQVNTIDIPPNDQIAPAHFEPLAVDAIELAPLDTADNPPRRQ